jgi:hypothetical protein
MKTHFKKIVTTLAASVKPQKRIPQSGTWAETTDAATHTTEKTAITALRDCSKQKKIYLAYKFLNFPKILNFWQDFSICKRNIIIY